MYFFFFFFLVVVEPPADAQVTVTRTSFTLSWLPSPTSLPPNKRSPEKFYAIHKYSVNSDNFDKKNIHDEGIPFLTYQVQVERSGVWENEYLLNISFKKKRN